MSSREQGTVSLLSNFALSFDGAVLGLTLAYAAVRTIVKFTSSSSALRKLQDAPSFRVSDLRSMLSVVGGSDSESDSWSRSGREELVIVRGLVMAKLGVEGATLVSQDSGDRAVIVQRTQTVPFILIEGRLGSQWPEVSYVVVNMDGSKHHLPLTTVGLRGEEKILPIGKDVSAVGLFFLKNGIAEIKSCNDLPYFLTEMTKDQMTIDLAFWTKILFWSSILLGLASIGILGFAFVRNWNRWKGWRQRRRDEQQRQSRAAVDNPNTHIAVDEWGDVPDECVICLFRRRRSAFVPCGHLVCCQQCALSVEREVSPKCPVCRRLISNSLRIYDS